MTDLRRYWEYNHCKFCRLRIYRSVQPRVDQLPLRSYWKHITSDKRECTLPKPMAQPGAQTPSGISYERPK